MAMNPIVQKWYAAGCPVDHTGIPHEVKAHIVRERAKQAGLTTFVETGTCYGDLLVQLLCDFEKIYSCELQPDFYAFAERRFMHHPHVDLRFGDSAIQTEAIVADLDGPAIFFLDAHYSGGDTARGEIDTPIIAELIAILGSEHSHVVVIDDARLFGVEKDYPTVAWVQQVAAEHGYSCEVEGDELVLQVIE